jgi:hypothetical protein
VEVLIGLPCPCAQCADSRNAPNHQNTSIIAAMLQHNVIGLQEALAECNTFISKDKIL